MGATGVLGHVAPDGRCRLAGGIGGVVQPVGAAARVSSALTTPGWTVPRREAGRAGGCGSCGWWRSPGPRRRRWRRRRGRCRPPGGHREPFPGRQADQGGDLVGLGREADGEGAGAGHKAVVLVGGQAARPGDYPTRAEDAGQGSEECRFHGGLRRPASETAARVSESANGRAS